MGGNWEGSEERDRMGVGMGCVWVIECECG